MVKSWVGTAQVTCTNTSSWYCHYPHLTGEKLPGVVESQELNWGPGQLCWLEP